MRTLTLLAALLLLVFQAKAQTLQETTEQVPAQDQPGDEDQDQPGDEDQDQLGVEDLNLLVDEIRDLIEAEDTVNSATAEERLTRAISGETPTMSCWGWQPIGGACRGAMESGLKTECVVEVG